MGADDKKKVRHFLMPYILLAFLQSPSGTDNVPCFISLIIIFIKQILHVVGSPSDEYNFCNNFLYAAACHPGEEFVFCFAVVFPDGKWSFLSTLKEAALEQEKKVNTDEAAARIIAWSPDAIHSHLFCVRGQTIYR